jgi:hypothetical protein
MNWLTKFLKNRKANKERKTAKEIATANHEPWIEIVGLDVDPTNLSEGAFDLDWNDIFIARLVKAGYRGRNDQEIVDQWFQDICKSVVAEEYEQETADPDKRRIIKRKQLENGRVEHS